MTRYFINKKTGVLHIEGMCRESTLRPYEIEFFLDEGEINGQYYRLCKNCAKKRASLQRVNGTERH